MELKVIKSHLSPSFAGRLAQSEVLRFSESRVAQSLCISNSVVLDLRILHGV
jgi:hypothetical protein